MLLAILIQAYCGLKIRMTAYVCLPDDCQVEEFGHVNRYPSGCWHEMMVYYEKIEHQQIKNGQ